MIYMITALHIYRRSGFRIALALAGYNVYQLALGERWHGGIRVGPFSGEIGLSSYILIAAPIQAQFTTQMVVSFTSERVSILKSFAPRVSHFCSDTTACALCVGKWPT